MANVKLSTSNASSYTSYTTYLSGAGSGHLNQLGANNGFSYNQPADTEPADNRPFDKRFKRIGVGRHSSGGFTPGVVVTAGSISTQAPGRKFTTYFQFNPTTIDISYTFDTSVIGALNPIFVPGQSGSQGLMLNQNVSFTLLFDRTYEVWTGPFHTSSRKSGYPASSGPYIYGAQWDVWSIERLVGIYGQAGGKGPLGPPAASLCNVKFGQQSTRNGVGGVRETGSGLTSGAIGGRAMGFQGWMTSLAVEYTRFDASMVPTRCAVALTFQQVLSASSYPGPATDPSGNSKSSSTGTGPTAVQTRSGTSSSGSYLPGQPHAPLGAVTSSPTSGLPGQPHA